MKCPCALIALAIALLSEAAAQSINLFYYPPFFSVPVSDTEDILSPGFLLTDEDGDDHTIYLRTGAISGPRFYYGKNNEAPRALPGTNNAEFSETYALFAEEEGLRFFFSSATSLGSGLSFSSLEISQTSEPSPPVEIFPEETSIYAVATSIGPDKTPRFLRSVVITNGGESFRLNQRIHYLDSNDLDGDGQNYLFETAYGSDPNDSQSLTENFRFSLFNLKPRFVADVPTGYSQVSPGKFRSVDLNLTIEIELSNDLRNWSLPLASVDSGVRSVGGQDFLTVTQTKTVEDNAAFQFMRYKVTRDD